MNKNSKSQTKLKDHTYKDKKLVPPLAKLGMSFNSWSDGRLPEMLWAALFTVNFPREEYLKRFQKIVDVACDLILKSKSQKWREEPIPVTLSGIANLSFTDQKKMIKIILEDAEAKKALLPMLFFSNLPSSNVWKDEVNLKPGEKDSYPLFEAIGECFFHQSQKATDCRWVKTLFMIKSGYIEFTANVKHVPKLILSYPAHSEEEMRKSRPSIRSMEIASPINKNEKPTEWSAQFWRDCYSMTPCLPTRITEDDLKKLRPSQEEMKMNRDKLHKINQELTNHFWQTEESTSKDPKHEVAFGISLYAVDIATSGVLMATDRSSIARLIIRTLAECLITLEYLSHKDDPKLWESFREHGSGQAKLVLQRSEEEKRSLKYLDVSKMGEIANDDKWVEFLPVGIGDWNDSNLRQRAIDSGLKGIYDDYYTWSSSFSHGQWGAIRESVFEICGNPLHRFHRIPLLYPFSLKDAKPDIYRLLSLITECLYKIYPKIEK